MTELFKCLALLCAVSVVCGFTDVRDDVGWFKNGSRIKNMFAAGVVNGIVDADCNDIVGNADVQGVCVSKAECAQLGGQSGGLCSLMGSCCYIRKTCGQTTNAKVSYFVPPNGDIPRQCPLTVKKYSSNVCQIRLDFEDFLTAQPTSVGDKAFMCNTDKFVVQYTPRRLNIPHLCGNNTGQHMYVPIDQQQDQIALTFQFAKRTDSGLSRPVWKIKITQLECPQQPYEHFLTAPSKLMTIHNNLKNKKQTRCCDYPLAPPGCLQYYTNSTGTFESFNYNGGNGPYIGNCDYAICLKKSPKICGAKYTFITLQMSKNDEDRCHPKEGSKSHDYVRITEGYQTSSDGKVTFEDDYCGQNNSLTVTANSYEPLYVGVHTDDLRKTDHEKGFKISYELEMEDICSPSE